MFFKKNKRKNWTTKKTYITYTLVETIRKKWAKYYSHSYLASIWKLDERTKDEKKQLKKYLEFQIKWEGLWLFEKDNIDPKIKKKWDEVLISYQEHQKIVNPEDQEEYKDERRKKEKFIEIAEASFKTEDSKTIWNEYICHEIAKELWLKNIFRKLKFTKRQSEVAVLLIIWRCVSPWSEEHTIKRAKEISAIWEVMKIDVKKIHRSIVYNVLKKLNEHNEEIQKQLEEIEKKYWSDDTIVLYDLTNAYFEWKANWNPIAKYWRSKEKRSDCKLVTLWLVVNKDGFPKYSKVYKWNQSEGETFKWILDSLEKRYEKEQLIKVRPLVVMDAWISTEENIKLLETKWYKYIAVKRSTKVWINWIENKWEYKLVKEMKKNNWEITNTIDIRRNNVWNEILLECKSKMKNEKEKSMMTRMKELFEQKLTSLSESIQKWTIKTAETINRKIWKIEWNFKKIKRYYDIEYKEKTKELIRKQNMENKNKYKKNREKYVLRTNFIEATDEEIRDIYNTIRRVEDSYRTMKTDLRLRPIFHQTEEYTKAHIFLTVLAYHIVNIIQYKLSKNKEIIRRSTFLEDMWTQNIWTLSYEDIKSKKNRIRIVNEPTKRQQIIYDNLSINSKIFSNRKIL